MILPLPRNTYIDDHDYEHRLANSIEKMVSNGLLRRRYKRKDQLEMINNRPEKQSPSKDSTKVGELRPTIKPLSKRDQAISGKLSELRRAIKIRHSDFAVDFNTSNKFY